MGVNVDYNSLEKYSKSLDKAIKTSSKEYEKIGVYSDGYYKQINSNTLQIENEYYRHGGLLPYVLRQMMTKN